MMKTEDILDEGGNLIGLVLVEVMTLAEARERYPDSVSKMTARCTLSGIEAGEA